MSGAGPTKQLISPDGRSIIAFGGSTIQLWRLTVTDSPTSLSSSWTKAPQDTQDFILELSPNKTLAAVARRSDNRVTVLDVITSTLQLTINTGSTKVHGLRMTSETRIAVVGDETVAIWDLPAENACNVYRFRKITPVESGPGLHASTSPDLDHVAVNRTGCTGLRLYDMDTGKPRAVVRSEGHILGFTPDGREVWCATANGEVDRWKINQDSKSDITGINRLGSQEPPIEFPWQSSLGYRVADDGWIFSSSGKRLLWLPHHWRSGVVTRRWNGKFLALLHGGLPEAVVMELEA